MPVLEKRYSSVPPPVMKILSTSLDKHLPAMGIIAHFVEVKGFSLSWP